MSRLLIPAVLLFCVAATTAAAESPSSNPSPNDLICRYEQDTGSHLKKRSCVTRAVREEQARRDQKEMQRLTQDHAHGPGKD